MTKAERQGAPWPGALAVSGGSDSLALMLLAGEWAARHARSAPVVLSVDHGLRPESLRDARYVAARARAAGLAAHVLRWDGPKPSSDIEATARQARYELLGAWCSEHAIAGLYLAHTLDDQAETFLLRLARGSGLDGLAAMKAVSPLPSPRWNAVRLVRPLLGERRLSLRSFLEARGENWLEDPMNSDRRFARIRLRAAWPALEECGLSPCRIAAAASHLGRAREALEEDARLLLARACRIEGATALLDAAAIANVPAEVGLRCLVLVLMQVSGRVYRPRFERLERLYAEVVAPGGRIVARTLHGCRIGKAKKAQAIFGPGTLLVTREAPRSA
jgi:tRNA(Ile)-lysidine synthase